MQNRQQPSSTTQGSLGRPIIESHSVNAWTDQAVQTGSLGRCNIPLCGDAFDASDLQPFDNGGTRRK